MSESQQSYGAHLRAFATSGAVATIVVAMLDALGAASTGSLTVAHLGAIAAYLCGVYGTLAILPLVLAAAVTRYVPETEKLGELPVVVSGFGALAGFTVISYEAILWTREHFQNVELSALLAASIGATSAAVLVALAAISLRITRHDRVSYVAMTAVWALVGAGTTGWLIHQNQTGFAQLSLWLLAMPVALCGVAFAAVSLRRRLVRLSTWVLLLPFAVLLLGVGAAAGFEFAGARTPGYVAEYAPLGSWVAQPIHRVTDFDGDGFSGFLGGGDCAPWDGTVAPGKLDIPGDGIDNNCVGGDASKSELTDKPVWFDLPDDWPDYSLLIVTVETLRADHVGFNGYSRKTTPNLDVLAKDSLVFERFYTTSTFTRLALPSLFTGRTPGQIDWEKQRKTKFPRLADSNPWLPTFMQTAGFRTNSITADFPAFTDKDSIGFDRGFDDFDPLSKLVYKGGTIRGFPSTGQVKKAKKWLDARKEDERFMLWIHLFEPHYLYQQFPKAPKFGKSRKDKYDSEIWGADKAIGDLVRHLKKTGRFDKTIIAVMGDHGEEFEEHGQHYHGSNLYEPQVRTPLLIHVPKQPGLRVATAASFVDVAPTLLNLTNTREGFDQLGGRSLAPLAFARAVSERPLFLEVWKVKTRSGYKVAVVNWPYKLMASGTTGKNQELYNLAEDPEEQNNLRASMPDVARPMEEALLNYLDSTSLEYHDPEQKPEPAEVE